MKQIDKSEWDEVSFGVDFCELPFNVIEVEKRLGLEFFEYREDGLGLCFGAYAETLNSMIFFRGFSSRENLDPGVVPMMRSFEKKPNLLLNEICESLGISKNELKWCKDDLV